LQDGVAGVSQCGIPPGQNFTYEFTLEDQRGTFWYHSHLSVQYTDSLFGPIIVHDPTERIPKVDEERIVFMGDWYHTYASILVSSFLNPTSRWVPTNSGIEPLADNLLMNGRNTYNCSIVSTTFPPKYGGQPTPVCNASEGGLYMTKVKSGRDYRLCLINHSSFFSFWFSIDNHTLAIVEMDGIEIEPIPFRGVYVNIGQRYSVIIRTNQTVGNYYMRATLPTTCFLPFVQYNSSGLNSTNFHAMGVLSYDDTDPGAPPIGVAGNTSNPYGASDNPNKNIVWEGCNDMPFDMPVPRRPEAWCDVKWENTTYIEYAFRQSQNVNRVFINKTSWAPLEHNATLWKTIGQNTSHLTYDDDQLVLKIGENGTGMAAQVVINGLSTMVHPWHLHGHDFQVSYASDLTGTPLLPLSYHLSF
jgi:FtsP/CotA-like multicopper oxidase with cupredoxin domain